MKDKFYNFFGFISEYALCGLLFFLPISNALVEIFVGLTFLGFVGRKIIKPDFRYLKSWLNIFLLFFLLFSAFSLLNSGQYINKSLHALFGKWMQYLGIFIIIQDSVYGKKIVKRGMSVFLFSASLAVLSGLSQYFFGLEFLRKRSMAVMNANAGLYGITSSFAHYNNFGGYLVVVLSLVFVLLLGSNYFGLKAGSLLIFYIISMVVIIFTFSRGSWLSLVISFIFAAALSKKYLKWVILFLLVIIGIIFLPVFQERLFFIFEFRADSGRFGYWSIAWKMIKEHPFLGMGVGTFMANFSKYLPNLSPSYAHNCYLQIWAETGIFSLVSFMAFVILLVCLGIRKFLVSRDFLLLGLLSGALGFLIHSFFDTNLYSLRLAVLFWTWAALISARISQVDNKLQNS